MPSQLLGHGGRQVAFAELQLGHDALGRFGRGHEVPPQLLGERLDQRDDLLLQQARHEPAELLAIELAQRLARHGERHAVRLRAGLEAIRQRQLHRPHRQAIGELRGVRGRRLLAQQVGRRQEQQLGILAFRSATPTLQASGRPTRPPAGGGRRSRSGLPRRAADRGGGPWSAGLPARRAGGGCAPGTARRADNRLRPGAC